MVPSDMSSNQLDRESEDRAPGRRGRVPGRAEGAKRKEILVAATARFGRDGYEDTRWANIASDVGVGPTALYHYFESKQHCLYVIVDEAIEDFRKRFDSLTTGTAEPLNALAAVLHDVFAISEAEILRNRVLVAEQGLLASPRTSPREERARQRARARARDLEFAWASFLAGAMEAGAIPRSDPRLLTRAILGLYNSIWQWYRPGGMYALEPTADFFKGRVLAMIGVGPGGVIRPRMVA
jgi:TetR/AcrR family transcriptional regulator, cholesterol catabolism regulator